MKKFYFLTMFILIIAVSASAQFTDNMESYDTGPINDANPMIWSTWSGNANSTAEAIIVTEDFASSGTKSGFIGNNQTQDIMLQLGNKEVGVWDLSFKMYIPSGRTAYFNFQGMTSPTGGANGGTGIFNSTNLVWNNTQSQDGGPGIGGAYPNITGGPTFTWSYEEDAWNDVRFIFNSDLDTYQFFVNDSLVLDQPNSVDGVVGAIDFFSIDSNNEFYVDDFVYQELDLTSVVDIDESKISIYPNPVSDFLQIDSKEIVNDIQVYSIIGEKLYDLQVNSTNPSINVTDFKYGTYILILSVDGKVHSHKFIK